MAIANYGVILDSWNSPIRNKRWPVDCPIDGCKGQKGARGSPGPLGNRVWKVISVHSAYT